MGVPKPQGVLELPPLSVNNRLFISLLLPHFLEMKYFHWNMRTYKIGGAPLA
jgi:hypothetical protein